MFPSIADYNQAIQRLSAGTFRSLANLSFIPLRTIPVKIFSFGAGSYAVVFKAKDGINLYAIRCFLHPNDENIERYKKIDNYLKGSDASWITKIDFLQNEIQVVGNYYPVLKMDWVEGPSLHDYINQILNNNTALNELQNEIVALSKSLEKLKIGHGDIQTDNIIISKNIDGRNIIKLIDYDGMYIPLFSNKSNLERGRPEFQHPNRSQAQFNEKIDRFSFWVILCAIEALKYDKNLWNEIMQGGFNTGSNLLFIGDDFKYFNNSRLVKKLYSFNKSSLNFYLNKLNQFCNFSPEIVEFPAIFVDSNNGNELEINQSEIEIISNPKGAIVLTSLLQRIGCTPIKIEKEKYLNKTLIISFANQINQVKILRNTKIIELTFSEIEVDEKFEDQEVIEQEIEFKEEKNPTILIPEIPPTIPPSPPGENDNSRMIVYSVITVMIITIVGLLITNECKKSIANTQSLDTTRIAQKPPLVVIPDNLSSKVEIQIQNSGINDLAKSKDNNEIIVKDFFDALSNDACGDAWLLTYNSTWESKGEDWFCSPGEFGGITKVIITNIATISHSLHKSEIHVEYYLEDINNGNRCFDQIITVQELAFPNKEVLWKITKMKDRRAPQSCSF
jgi:hypothetical protein